MKIDLYAKGVLTVIALALVAIATQNLMVAATAQQRTTGIQDPAPCGTTQLPCHVKITNKSDLCGTGAMPCYVTNTRGDPLFTTAP